MEKEQERFEVLRECIIRAEKEKESAGKVENKTDEERSVLSEYQEIYEKNRDLAGWIRIDGTKIDYPVMQNLEDREYYLHRNFEKEKSYAGVPFVGRGDLISGRGDIFIYGHNMKNHTMFAELLNYQDEHFWEKYPIVELDTLWEQHEYIICSVFFATEDDWKNINGLFYPVNWELAGGREKYLKEIEKRSLYETGISLNSRERLAFFVTCSYHKDDGRFVVVGIKK